MARTTIPALFVLGAAAVGSASAQELQPFMGEPISGLTPAELALFDAGRDAYAEPLQVADGLGPIFNEVSCGGCHNQPAIGGHGSRLVTRFGVAAAGGSPFDPLANLGGSLLQDQSIDLICREVVPPQANVTAQRGTPTNFGIGLLGAIDDADIIALANNQPAGLNGMVRMNELLENPTGAMRVGRFGWKGGISTVLSFSIDAAQNEMGLSSVFLPFDNAPNGDQVLLAQCDTVADPEDQPDAQGLTFVDRITHFQQWLAPPPQMPVSGHPGEALFTAVGCADCHTPSFTTSPTAPGALANRVIRPYSDFLLHDMGTLGDQIVDGVATEQIMMTRTLWGLAVRGSFLHDARAGGASFEDNIDFAVNEHGGEGSASRTAYQALSQADRDSIVAFLATLGRGEFDFEADNDLDEFDWFFIEPLLNGPAPATPHAPEDPGAQCDVDQDGDFDIREFGLVQRAWTGQ